MAETALPKSGAITQGDFARRFGDRIEPDLNSGCHLWAGSTSKAGYGTLTWESGTRLAHRCAFEDANGVGAADGIVVRHRCDTPPCVNEKHLLGGTDLDNARDAIARGRVRHVRGEGVNTARLSEAEVYSIRRRAADGETVASLAREFEMSHSGMDAVVKRVSWAHLPAEESRNDH